MPTTGTIAKISTDPRAVSIQVAPPPAPPIAFSPLTDDQFLLLATTPEGKTVTVTGTPPNCTGVSRP